MLSCHYCMLCSISFYAPNMGLLISKGGQNFSRNSLGFSMSKSCPIWKLVWHLMSWQCFEFLFIRKWNIVTLQSNFSEGMLNVFVSDVWLVFCTYRSTSTSSTLVKVLFNLILTIFYTSWATPVITSWTFVTWTCNDV